ncbi:hypothetical protein INT45_011733 [Circinella minor]|uniref:Uncharacterized protein n=1 Tax=Circinella minor TaxID=1195481 RepID=A0A8H7VKI2_9FUNG|nr:hypothetical protein INT45_011733 [Circinella minor]
MFTDEDTQPEQKEEVSVKVPSMKLINNDNESSLSVVMNGSYCDNCYERLNPNNTELQRREQKEGTSIRRINDMLPTVNTHCEKSDFAAEDMSSGMMISSAHIPLKRQNSSNNVSNNNVVYHDQESLKRCRTEEKQACFDQGDLYVNQPVKGILLYEVHNNVCTPFEKPYEQEHTDSIVTHNNNFDDNSDIDTKLKDKVDHDSNSSIEAGPEKRKLPIRNCQQVESDSKEIYSDALLFI